MAAKVQWLREAWWVVTHFDGRRKKKRVGPTREHKRQAEKIAEKVNAQLALGTFTAGAVPDKPRPCDAELRSWHVAWAPTMKPSYEIETERIIRTHLAPFFATKDVRQIREDDLLHFIRAKLDAGLASKTIRNCLQVLGRVLNL